MTPLRVISRSVIFGYVQSQIHGISTRRKRANATAQEVIIKALGEAEANVIEANATKQAIELILELVGQSRNETRIAEIYLWVQTLQKIAPDIDILIVGTDKF